MLRVEFYGKLKERFGPAFDLDVRTVAEAMIFLRSTLKGFREYMVKNSFPGYHVILDSEYKGVDDLMDPCGSNSTVCIVPCVAGAGGDDGFFQTILGAALIFADQAFFHTGYLTKIGLVMALGGVSRMMAPSPVIPSGGKAGDDPGHSFNGVSNVMAQGQPVPVAYGGPILVGSLTVSIGTSADTDFPSGKGGGPFSAIPKGGVDTSLWQQMSGVGGVSAWYNGGDGRFLPWIWNIDP